jgi:hypothetical protein
MNLLFSVFLPISFRQCTNQAVGKANLKLFLYLKQMLYRVADMKATAAGMTTMQSNEVGK